MGSPAVAMPQPPARRVTMQDGGPQGNCSRSSSRIFASQFRDDKYAIQTRSTTSTVPLAAVTLTSAPAGAIGPLHRPQRVADADLAAAALDRPRRRRARGRRAAPRGRLRSGWSLLETVGCAQTKSMTTSAIRQRRAGAQQPPALGIGAAELPAADNAEADAEPRQDDAYEGDEPGECAGVAVMSLHAPPPARCPWST